MTARRATPRRQSALALGILALGALFFLAGLLPSGGGSGDAAVPAADESSSVQTPIGEFELPSLVPRSQLSPEELAAFDPLDYEGDDEGLLAHGRAAYSHVLYAKSPGGAEATAARVAGWRQAVEAAAGRHDVDADTLEALVFLESAGYAEAMAGGTPEGAVGLGQILPGTATSLLAMTVDLAESRRLTRRIDRERRRGRPGADERIARLEARRRAVDTRFDPAASLDGASRYLAIGRGRFGREDLALASYHMGMGNLEDVIEEYVEPRPLEESIADTVSEYDITYPRLFYDTFLDRNPATYARLVDLGDDSRSYLFRLEAAREIMRLWREDREQLSRLAGLHGAKASAEEVLRPREEFPPYRNAQALVDAFEEGELLPLPHEPRRLGLRIDPEMGGLARYERDRALFRALRPEALATLLYIGKEVKALSGGGSLKVTSTVRDLPYQKALVSFNDQATPAFSLHTTGFALDIGRNFRSRRQRQALFAVLDRLQSQNVIAWVEEPTALHLTVGPEGERFLPLLDTLNREGA